MVYDPEPPHLSYQFYSNPTPGAQEMQYEALLVSSIHDPVYHVEVGYGAHIAWITEYEDCEAHRRGKETKWTRFDMCPSDGIVRRGILNAFITRLLELKAAGFRGPDIGLIYDALQHNHPTQR